MRHALHRDYTLDEYFQVEEISPVRHEFLDGTILAMAGASVAHNRVAADVLAALVASTRGGSCEAFGADLRVATPDGLFTYPDALVVCGPPALVPDRPDTVTNPVVLVEVLSPSTRDYDRGEKLEQYKGIPGLVDVLLIEQDAVAVEHVHRSGSGWAVRRCESLDDVVSLAGAPVALPLREIYRRIA